MEAMSIETLLLSTWEEDGFVGKARVPLDQSDVDVLAIHAGQQSVRVGECKVREGSQKVYVVDDSSLVGIEVHPDKDFTAWMTGDWSSWLSNLPKLWDEKGRPAVPWLLDLPRVTEIEVVFCCNLIVLCDPKLVNDSLARAASRFLRQNGGLARWLENGGAVGAKVTPTAGVVTDLLRAVSLRIDDGYGRRFANHFKDLFREVHRYLRPALDRLPYGGDGQRLDTRKKPCEERIRKETVLELLKAMGVERAELRDWVADLHEGSGPGNP
jgi:hypothetical protein